MKKNIFLQKSKEKFNPDVLKKKEIEDKTRTHQIFKKSNITYNSITNQVIDNIKNQKDLELPKDNPIINIEQIILQKKKEREEFDNNNKPIKQKILQDNISYESENFNELKDDQTTFINKQKKISENNKNKFDDIMNNLKKLGIIEKK